MYHYRLFGLDIASELDLPELRADPSPSGQAADVQIRLGKVDTVCADLTLVGAAFSARPGEVRFDSPDTGRYLVSDGERIVVDPAPGASPRNVRLMLLGWGLGILCHQRGWLPLHASAIEVDGSCVAFSAPSGTGKSTLAAGLAARGYTVVSDDVCAVTGRRPGEPLAVPGLNRIKLWRESVLALGVQEGGLEQLVAGYEKYRVPGDRDVAATPRPLRIVYLLDPTHEGDGSGSGFTRLLGMNAVEAVMSNTYGYRFVHLMGTSAEHFLGAARVAQHAAVFRVRWQRDFDIFETAIDKLERHFQHELQRAHAASASTRA